MGPAMKIANVLGESLADSAQMSGDITTLAAREASYGDFSKSPSGVAEAPQAGFGKSGGVREGLWGAMYFA